MTGRTIPVTRTDGSEVAGEATQALIHDQIDLKSSEVVAGLRGAGGKTLTDLWNELASTLAVSDGTTHTALASIYAALDLLATAAQLPVSLGSKTANGSLSVTGSTDGVFYVGGVSADGVAPTNQAVRVSGVDGGGLKRTLATDASGYQYAKQLPASSQAINLTGAAQRAVIAVPDGFNAWSVILNSGSFTGTLTFQYSPDNQVNWYSELMQPMNIVAFPAVSTSLVGVVYEGPIPIGATHVAVYATALSSGSATGTINISPRVFSPPQNIEVYLNSTASRIGSVASAALHYLDSSTALTTVGPTYTGVWRDLMAIASGSVINASSYAKTFSTLVVGDKPFNLQIDVSEDASDVNTPYFVAATQINGGQYVAELTMAPKARYARIVATLTGGVNMTKFRAWTNLLAN